MHTLLVKFTALLSCSVSTALESACAAACMAAWTCVVNSLSALSKTKFQPKSEGHTPQQVEENAKQPLQASSRDLRRELQALHQCQGVLVLRSLERSLALRHGVRVGVAHLQRHLEELLRDGIRIGLRYHMASHDIT